MHTALPTLVAAESASGPRFPQRRRGRAQPPVGASLATPLLCCGHELRTVRIGRRQRRPYDGDPTGPTAHSATPAPRLRASGATFRFFGALFCAAALALLAPLAQAATERAVVVTTPSVLGAAAQAVGGEGVAVETILPPGSCPGHFDLEPAQVRRLLSATVFFRHEFQDFLDSRLLANDLPPDRIAALPAPGGLCIPDTLATLAREAADELAARLPDEATSLRARAAALAAEAQTRGAALRQRTARLHGKPVAAAPHQAAFLRWLGLEVVCVLPGGDDPAPGVISRTLAEIRTAGARAGVGNVPSGRRLPAALAESAALPLAMFDNFPSSCTPADYWAMLDRNVDALLAAFPE